MLGVVEVNGVIDVAVAVDLRMVGDAPVDERRRQVSAGGDGHVGHETAASQASGSGYFVKTEWRDRAGKPIAPHLYHASGKDACGVNFNDSAGVKGAVSSGGIKSAASFEQWYRDDLGVNLSDFHTIVLTRDHDGVYTYSTSDFHPIDGRLLGNLTVYYEDEHPFSAQERELAGAIANQVAAAVGRFAAMSRIEESIRNNELIVGALGHDLRNPLGAILSSTQLAMLDAQGEPLVAGLAHTAGDGIGEAGHEGVGAIGDEEHDAQVAGAGEERGGEVAAEIEGLDGAFDLFGGLGPDTGARIEHAIDGGERNARRPRHIMHRRTPRFVRLVQSCPPGADVAARSVAPRAASARSFVLSNSTRERTT